MKSHEIATLVDCLPKIPDEKIQKKLELEGKTKEFINQILQMKVVFEHCAKQGINILPIAPKQENYFSNQVTIGSNATISSSFDPRVRELKGKEVMVIPTDYREINGIKTVRIMPLNEIINSGNSNDPANNPIYINPKFFKQNTISESLKNELKI